MTNSKRDRIGLREIANLAQVSVATVSRVLNGNTRVDPALQHFRLLSAKLLGKTANPTAPEWAREAGVMAYLLKPLRPAELAPALDLAFARFREARDLKQSLEDRKVIERAKGRLMERHALTEEQAFQRLRRAAIARPIPRVPPVTRTALPSIRSAVAGSITGTAPCRPRFGATRPRGRRVRAG